MLYVDRRAEKADHFCRACRPGAMAINRGHVGAVLEESSHFMVYSPGPRKGV